MTMQVLSKGKLLLLVAFLLAVFVDFFVMHGVYLVEHPLQDALLRAQAADRPVDSDVVVINVDEPSLLAAQKDMGTGWPWPRAMYAQLLQGVLKQQPRAVIFDIYFVDPSSRGPDDDKYLIDVATKSDRVFFPLVRLEDADDSKAAPLKDYPPQLGFMAGPAADPAARAALLFPLPQLALTGRVGIINFLQDRDKVGRRYYLDYPVAGWGLPSLPKKVADALHYPLPEGSYFAINWRRVVHHQPFYDVYADMQRRVAQRPADEFRDKIVIIGTNAAGLGDSHPTPLAATYAGVDILATAISNLKDGDWLRYVPNWMSALIATLLLAGVMLLISVGFGPFRTALALVAVSLLLVLLDYHALRHGWLLPTTQPLLFAWLFYVSMALAEYLRERRERVMAVSMFGRFLDPRVVNELVKTKRNLLDQGAHSREVTVLFSDIRGFTTLSESRTPEEVVAILNRYFTRQVEVVFRHHGTVDKFIGDCIMAFWGAPVPDPEQAKHAVAAAIEMGKVVEDFRKDLGNLSTSFDIGVGVHTGPAVVGFMGAETKLDYTAIGDTVNLASRIEGQTKGVARILVSAATRAACGEAFDFTERGTYKVKGRAQPVELFEPKEKA